MSEVLLNKKYSTTKMVSFNGVPTILQIKGETGGNRARVEIYISSANTSIENEVTINNVTVKSTTDINKAVNNVFWVTSQVSLAYNRTMAYYFVQALNSTQLANEYNIYVDNSYNDNIKAKVVIEAKEVGSRYNITVTTNTSAWDYQFPQFGDSADPYTGSKILVDIYATSGNNQSTIADSASNQPTTHVIQLEKQYNKDSVSFDLSPILASLTQDGNTLQYRYIVSYLKNKTYNKILDVSNNFAINGYQVNQGENYLLPDLTKNNYLLHNVSRGEATPYLNNTTLYYCPQEAIYISLLSLSRTSSILKIKYLDSAKNSLYEQNVTVSPLQNLTDVRYVPSNIKNAFYLTVEIPDVGVLCYNNIQPTNYADRKDIQTIYWRNSYGGISHFTFTGRREEERTAEKTMYRQSDLYYYDDNRQQQILSTKPQYTVTLSSHYIDGDGRYEMYDLNNSKKVWTYVNGKEYPVIVDSLSIAEIQRGVYQITLTYNYASTIL